jgi:glycosyltransferase involved in cell wall biosynthesis
MSRYSKTRPGWIFISNVRHADEFEWLARSAREDNFPLVFILFNAKGSPLERALHSQGLKCSSFPLPFKAAIPAYIFLFWVRILIARPAFVHCHLLEASLIGITASWLAGVKKRIHTRHHSDLHHVYHPHAVRYDRFINRLSTHIVSVSTVVSDILVSREQVDTGKIVSVPHGIPANEYQQPEPVKIDAMGEKYGLTHAYPVVGVVSRFTEWKGVQYIIPAFKKIMESHRSAKLVLANAKGNYRDSILSLLSELPASSYVLVDFEEQMPALFKTFDVFVHVPVSRSSEAFGQVYLEAFRLGVPVVCTLSGVAVDLVRDGENALVVPYRDAGAIAEAMNKMLSEPGLKESLSARARSSADAYTFEEKYARLKKLYLA